MIKALSVRMHPIMLECAWPDPGAADTLKRVLPRSLLARSRPNLHRKVCVRILFALLLCLCVASVSFGASGGPTCVAEPGPALPLCVVADLDGRPLGRAVDVLEDPTGALTIDDVTSAHAARFIPSQSERPSFGFATAAYWFRFRVINPGDRPVPWYLEIAYGLLDDVALYVAAPDGRYRVLRVGDRMPFAARFVDHHNFVFRLEEPVRSERVYYLRIATESSLIAPLHAWNADHFAVKNAREQVVYGAYFGIIVGLTLYSLALFLAIRDRTYLLYTASVAVFGIAAAALSGLGFQYLWPWSPWWANVVVPWSVSATSAVTLAFARAIMAPARKAHGLGYNALIVISVGIMVLSIFGPYRLAMRASAGIAIVGLAWAAGTAVVAARRGSRAAFVFLLACGAFLLGAFLYALRAFGVLPSTFLTTWSVWIGSAMECVLMSVAVADQITDMRRSKDAQISAAQAELEAANRELLEANTLLEDRVEQRTNQLAAAKDAAESASRAKSEFLANMSHEIRTPLNGILGMLEITLDAAESEDQRENLKAVQTSAVTLLSVLNDILDLGKVEAGRLELAPVPFDPVAVLTESLQLSAVRAHAKGLELIADVGGDVPRRLVGDALRLRQVLNNLVNNAVKFTDRGEVAVLLEASVTEGCVELQVRVSDTGMGIPKHALDSIFDAFTQVDGSTSRRFGGTGLGLAISRRLVELMGGELSVQSEEGKGSTFLFTARFEPMSESLTPEEHGHRGLLEGRRVLVVEDNTKNREVLTRLLERWGLEVTAVASSEDAQAEVDRAAAAANPFDIALVDATIRPADGFELARRVRERKAAVKRPVVMLKMDTWATDVARCRELGVRTYLRKPVDPGDLLDIVLDTVGAIRNRPLAPSIPDATPRLPTLNVLLAEDNAINQQVAAHFLRMSGHRVTLAGDGVEVIKVWQTGTFDVILMDCQMPLLNGYDATKRIRTLEASAGHRVPIVAMTANAMKGDREICIESGMDGYVAKPVSRESLDNEILAVLAALAPHKLVAPTPGEPDSCRTLDHDAMLARMGGSESLLRRTMRMFVQDASGHLEEVRDALGSGDCEALKRATHTIKGIAMNLGVEPLANASRRLETCGHENAPIDMADVRRFREALLATTQAFESYLGSEQSDA